MNTEKTIGEAAIEKLDNKWPGAYKIRDDHKGIAELLRGSFYGEFNVYDSEEFVKTPGGIVVSRGLFQKKEYNPTIGLIAPGEYEFNTGKNTELMLVLEGTLRARADDGPESILTRYASILAPPGTKLKLATLEDVFYLCMYNPKM